MSVSCQAAPAEAGVEQAAGRGSCIPLKPVSKSCGAAPCRPDCWLGSVLQVLQSKPELGTVCAYLCMCALNDCSLCV